MNVFYMSKIKKLCFLSCVIIMTSGICFGIFYYNKTPQNINMLLNQLFISNKNNYYLISSLAFIFINTYLSSSYIGFILHGFSVFIKAIQITYSFIYVNNQIEFTIILFLLLIIQILCEIFFTITITIQCQELSLFVYYSLFQANEKLSLKKSLNNYLNIIIYSLIVLFICIFIRKL